MGERLRQNVRHVAGLDQLMDTSPAPRGSMKRSMAAILVCLGFASVLVGQTEILLKTSLVNFELRRFARSHVSDAKATELASSFLG